MGVDDGMSAKTLGPENKTLVVEAAASSEQGNGVVKIVQTKITETGISAVGEACGGKRLQTLGLGGGGLGDADMKGVSSLLGLSAGGGEFEIEADAGKEGGKVVVSVLAVEENGEKGVKETEEGSGKCGEGGSSLDVGNDFLSKTDERERKNSGEEAELEVNGDSSPKDGKFDEMNEAKEGEDDDHGYEFTVGDFVWCKSKSHLWWPGMIYDHSDASAYAAKLKLEDGLLVAYFGDDTFAWCYPFQLKPFEENFEELSKLSQSKNFVNAVQNALDVISRLVELKLTCPCVPEEIRIGLDRPVAANTGIKEKVFVPEGGIRKISVARYEPRKLLANVKSIAHHFSLIGTLELTVLKSCLAAFYRAKGGYRLPSFYGAQPVPGLEDNTESGEMKRDECNYSVEIPVPGPFVDDWHSSSPSQNVLQKCSLTSDGRIHPKRKRKSIVEIMGRATNVHAKDLISGRTKRKGSDGIDGQSEGSLSAKQKKKTVQDEALNTEPDGSDDHENRDFQQLGEETDDGSMSVERKMTRSLSTRSDDSAALEQSGRSSLSRERKLSKYLSPPFTTLIHSWSPRSKYPETESPKAFSKTRPMEQMTKAADGLVNGSPAISAHGNENGQKEDTEDHNMEHVAYTSKPKLLKQASPCEVLCDVHAAALNPSDPIESEEFNLVREFIAAFRLSVFSEEANVKVQNRGQPGRKRKALDASGKELVQMDHVSREVKSQKKKIRKSEEEKLDTLKPKQASGSSSGKKSERIKEKHKKPADALLTKNNERDERISSSSLLVSFGPGSSLPTKDDLIEIYSRFGPLNVDKTDMFSNNFCARIVFARSADADKALKDCKKESPFGSSSVSFQLLSSSETSKTYVQKMSEKAASSKEVNSDNKSSQLKFVKDKLEMLTSMLDNSAGEVAPELKSKLQGEMKGLVEKVNEMVASYSS